LRGHKGFENFALRGRKPRQESRAIEFRRELIDWKQTPESARPPLRALARELGTSHQLLTFYLNGLEKWQGEEYWRQAREIRAHAIVEDRPLTQWEDEQARACDRTAFHFTTGYMLRYSIKRMKKDSERGPLCWHDIQSLKMLALKFPEAQELLEKCLQNGIKQRKRFGVIVKETPRQEGETYIAWVHRIRDQCAKYDVTKRPTVITEELLERYSQGGVKKRRNNLPAVSSGAAKSFRRA
jgi:hypothetical protein